MVQIPLPIDANSGCGLCGSARFSVHCAKQT